MPSKLRIHTRVINLQRNLAVMDKNKIEKEYCASLSDLQRKKVPFLQKNIMVAHININHNVSIPLKKVEKNK